ncbi:long-chain fatty acid transport protein 1-like [Babylonia areolata]|uniref:long-chain fatty acid transport protein 1-like n=1 Tax=Babylonia areolata TaxID=304850 RepID=UPI003FD19308
MQHNSSQFKFARQLSAGIRTAGDVAKSRMWQKGVLFLTLGVFVKVFFQTGALLAFLAVLAVYLLTGGWRFAYVVARTFQRDARALKALLMVNLKVRSHTRNNMTIAKLFQAQAKKHPEKPCFLFEDQTWTYGQVEEHTNRVANFFYEAGYRKGDTVALFMENRPDFVCFWLGLSKIGVVSALINFNLRLKPLAHCINAADAKALIFGGEMSEAVKDILPELPAHMRLFCSGRMASNDLMPTHLDQFLDRASTYPPPSTQQTFRDKLFYIYTSGTTGLPKAAVVTHTRFFYMSYGINDVFRIKPSDIVYDILPLYHTAGGILGIGQVIQCGATVAMRPKFSASQFWKDCVKYNCTVAQYIGEICRYLLAQPFRPEEQQHRVRLMFGNGVKPQIWRQFQERFGVSVIGEFYGATEGNCSVVNFENKVGAVGFTTRIAPFLYPVTLVKVDPETGNPVRDSSGMCVHAQPGELGELVGKIVKGNPMREFDGYVNKGATQKKILHDVFKRGDVAFMTGDVLLMDELGYLYFHDRTGDTFRWRGENVSTSEVEAIISNNVGLRDAVVYGVEVPGSEGCAGMAAIADEDNSLDLVSLTSALQRSLPSYARPVFLRLMKEVDTTGTFKLKKTDLRKESFDPGKVKDRLFYFSPTSGKYEPITASVYLDICNGKVRI